MAMPASAHRYWTPADVLAEFPESTSTRYECIAGELLVTPSPRPAHTAALGLLHERLVIPLLAAGQSLRLFTTTTDLHPTADALVQPDLFVLRERGSAAMRLDAPDCVVLIAEVLSPGTAGRDRGLKRRLYQRIKVPEYWIVDVDARCVERWTPAATAAEVLRDELAWTDPVSGATVNIDLPAFFAAVWES